VTQYLNRFGVVVANRIKESFSPLFDPATEEISDEIKRVNGYIYTKTGYSLYPAQLAVAESVKRRLDTAKVAMIVAECGSGKTKIGATALAAVYALSARQKQESFNVILCPSHVTGKWVRELQETVPNSFAAVARNIADVNRIFERFETGTQSAWLVMSKESARDGYMRRPAVSWSRVKKGFVCPECGAVQETRITDDGIVYMVPADQFHFLNENDKNHKCGDCGSVLWEPINPTDLRPEQNKWVRIGEYGFIYRPFALAHLARCKNKGIRHKIQTLIDDPDLPFQAVGAYRRYPISTYIKKKLRCIDGLVCDELHQYKGDSGQGEAMSELVGAAKKVIGMTATLINGYSSGIFYLLFRVAPELMLLDGKSYSSSKSFNDEYGVTEAAYELDEAEYNANRRVKRRKIRERQLPGVSPLVYSRFLINSAAFLSLNDMGKQLPDYEEIPVKLEMNPEVKAEYKRIEGDFLKLFRDDKKLGKKLLSQYLNLTTAYPYQPYGHGPIIHPEFKKLYGDDLDEEKAAQGTLIKPRDTGTFDDLHEKDLAVLDIVERKIKNGERVMIYTSWTRLDTQDKLMKLLREKGYKAETLTVRVPPGKREEWVQKKVDDGLQVLITNPSLVETGLDLNAFTTLIYYNIGYNLFTFRQSSRRSWRINQDAPRIEVYILYYEGSMQERALKLMASKLAVATIIEGNLSDEGLAAMSECSDMTTLLARELTLGIKNEVEDIAEAFKKMAIIKDGSADVLDSADYMILPENIVPLTQAEPEIIVTQPVMLPNVSRRPTAEEIAAKVRLAIDTASASPAKSRRGKSFEPDPNQISLFDKLAS
jgi:superfamily II DNA or RNA helicase